MKRALLLLASSTALLSGCAPIRETAPRVALSPALVERQPQVAKVAYDWGCDLVGKACGYLKVAAARSAASLTEVDPEVERWQQACENLPDSGDPSVTREDSPVLAAKGLLDEACHKFDDAYREGRPFTGLAIYRGLCAEQRGLTAEALRRFREAQQLDKRVQDAAVRGRYEAQVQTDIARVEHGVGWLLISVNPRPADLQVLLDNVPVSTVDVSQPVEPGRRMVWARAHGFVDQRLSLAVVADRHYDAKLALHSDHPFAKPLALGTGAAGLLALGIGAYFGIRTLSLVSQSNDHCDAANVCTNEGADLRDCALGAQAKGLGFAAGGLLTIGGSALLYTW